MATQNWKHDCQHGGQQDQIWQLARRQFLRQSGLGFGAMALAGLAGASDARAAGTAEQAQKVASKFKKAKHVIYLHMEGAPSQLDMFDYKPRLQEMNGKPCPKELLEGKRFAFIRGVPSMLGSPYKFARHGKNGTWVSELLPGFAKIVDKVTMVKSMQTDEFNHAPAQLFALTGKSQFGGASLGSWVNYGLGSLSKDLPGYVVMLSGGKVPSAGKSLWGSGFLPSLHQGVEIRSQGDPVLFVSDPPGMDRPGRRRTLDALKSLNQIHAGSIGDPETDTRIAQYELAFRMQASVPDVMDIAREPKKILDLYGARPNHKSAAESADDPRTLYRGDDPTFANNCLLARRLVERGVRFVQLFDWGWDHHGISPGESIDETLPIKCRQIDRAIHGLITDLEQRGLLDETLVVWGGEFGRTPMQQNAETQKYIGRDHHPFAYTMWMAGAGVGRGNVVGETDEIGFYPTKDPVHIRDMQATILHLMGVDPWRLSYPFSGLNQRLIGPEDNKAHIVKKILA